MKVKAVITKGTVEEAYRRVYVEEKPVVLNCPVSLALTEALAPHLGPSGKVHTGLRTWGVGGLDRRPLPTAAAVARMQFDRNAGDIDKLLSTMSLPVEFEVDIQVGVAGIWRAQ